MTTVHITNLNILSQHPLCYKLRMHNRGIKQSNPLDYHFIAVLLLVRSNGAKSVQGNTVKKENVIETSFGKGMSSTFPL